MSNLSKKNLKKITLIFTGGGSGGHTMSAFAMIEAVKDYLKIATKFNIEVSISDIIRKLILKQELKINKENLNNFD